MKSERQPHDTRQQQRYTLCRGMRARSSIFLCSSLMGVAKPLMILQAAGKCNQETKPQSGSEARKLWAQAGSHKPGQNFQGFSNAIVLLNFIHKLKKDVTDGATDEGAALRQFAVHAVGDGFQVIALPNVFAIK